MKKTETKCTNLQTTRAELLYCSLKIGSLRNDEGDGKDNATKQSLVRREKLRQNVAESKRKVYSWQQIYTMGLVIGCR